MVLKAVPIYASDQSDDLWLAPQSWTGWQVCFRPTADLGATCSEGRLRAEMTDAATWTNGRNTCETGIRSQP